MGIGILSLGSEVPNEANPSTVCMSIEVLPSELRFSTESDLELLNFFTNFVAAVLSSEIFDL